MLAAILVCGVTVLTACSSNEDNGGTKDDGKARKALLIILPCIWILLGGIGWMQSKKNKQKH